jgi:Ca2+-binding EF-hand superfamily protein
MHDMDNNGTIEPAEMKKIFQSIFKIISFKQKQVQSETSEEMAERVFREMDCNSDGKVEAHEFIESCLKDETLLGALSHFRS